MPVVLPRSSKWDSIAGNEIVDDSGDSPMSKYLSFVSAGEYSKDYNSESVAGNFDDYTCCGEVSNDSCKGEIWGACL